MLLAVLYSADEAVLATALACDHQPLGDYYWSDVQGIDLPNDFETAYVLIEDADFANRLLDLSTQFGDGHSVATTIEEYLSRRNPNISKRQAA